MCSVDNGVIWYCLGLKEVIEFDGVVCSLVVDFLDFVWVLVGVDVGICLSIDGGVYFKCIVLFVDD